MACSTRPAAWAAEHGQRETQRPAREACGQRQGDRQASQRRGLGEVGEQRGQHQGAQRDRQVQQPGHVVGLGERDPGEDRGERPEQADGAADQREQRRQQRGVAGVQAAAAQERHGRPEAGREQQPWQQQQQAQDPLPGASQQPQLAAQPEQQQAR
jgi:hypothetical protein